MKTYRPGPGARYRPKEAQALGQILEEIGEFKPQAVVDRARPKNSPIHRLFEWDDRKAGEKFRRQQAQQHVAHLRIVIKTPKGNLATKAFHSVVIRQEDETSERAFVAMQEVRRNPEYRAQVIEKAMAESIGWKERYAEYRDVFGGVFKEISKAEKKVMAVS